MTPNNRIAHLARCSNCNQVKTFRYIPLSGRYFCSRPECQAASRKFRTELSRKPVRDRAADAVQNGRILRLHPDMVSGPLTVIHDPLDKGGWKPGKKFSADEWVRMYRLLTFTPGTLLSDTAGRVWRFEIGGE